MMTILRSRPNPDAADPRHSGSTGFRQIALTAAAASLVAILGLASASAQSVTSFKPAQPAQTTKKDKVQEPKPNTPAPASAAAPSAAVATPSRYIGVADLEPYVAAVTEVLSIRKRGSDPFGQLQDPDAKPVIKTSVAKTTKRIAPVQSFPFSDIINRIKINTVMPKEKKFLVGTRSFIEGGHMNLAFRTKNISVSIVSVTASQIDLKNLETGETASIKINLLPVGMTPGTGGITAPGMVKDQPNAPIDIESPDATAESALQTP